MLALPRCRLRFDHFVALLGQEGDQERSDRGVVVADQDALGVDAVRLLGGAATRGLRRRGLWLLHSSEEVLESFSVARATESTR